MLDYNLSRLIDSWIGASAPFSDLATLYDSCNQTFLAPPEQRSI